jgi:hypothetical protein
MQLEIRHVQLLALPPSPSKLIRDASWPSGATSFPLFTPPPPHPCIWDNFQQPCQVSRMASTLEVVSMIADIGQQQ